MRPVGGRIFGRAAVHSFLKYSIIPRLTTNPWFSSARIHYTTPRASVAFVSNVVCYERFMGAQILYARPEAGAAGSMLFARTGQSGVRVLISRLH